MRILGHKVATSYDSPGWTEHLVGSNHIELGIVLDLANREGAHATLREQGRPLTLEEITHDHTVSEHQRQEIITWLTRYGLLVTCQSPLVIWAHGTFEAASRTLSIGFQFRQDPSGRVFRPTEDPEVPDALAGSVVAIVGLENVVKLSPLWRRPTRTDVLANAGQGFFPQDLEKAYQFPAPFDGTGQCIGLLEFSNGYSLSDVRSFWGAMGISPPALDFVSVDGTPNDGGTSPQDMEATLDVEWAGGMASGAQLVVYETSSGTSDQSFGLSVLKALDYAVHDTVHRPTVLSISYGDAEGHFPFRELAAWDTVMAEGGLAGITTFVASGDQGAYGINGPGRPVRHVDAPASCPHAMAVGGTHLELNADGTIQSETGWTDTNNNGASGGGISQLFGMPPYQDSLSLPVPAGDHAGRGVPDVAANADPDTGYAVMFQGSMTVVGGTSAASPLWAALWARLNQARVQAHQGPIGSSHGDVYHLGPTSAFHDITVGNNSYNGVAGYSCTPGWDAVTGWGSPVGSRLVGELS